MAERITQADFARLIGVNRSTVNRGVKAGRLTIGKDKRLDRDQALREWQATESPMPHHQARKAQFEQQKAQPAVDGLDDDLPNMENSSALLRYQTYKLQKAKAEKAAMEVDQLAGALVERSEIDFVLADFGNTLRGLVEGIPDRLAGPLAAHRGDANAIHKTLEDFAHDVLTEMSEHMARRISDMSK